MDQKHIFKRRTIPYWLHYNLMCTWGRMDLTMGYLASVSDPLTESGIASAVGTAFTMASNAPRAIRRTNSALSWCRMEKDSPSGSRLGFCQYFRTEPWFHSARRWGGYYSSRAVNQKLGQKMVRTSKVGSESYLQMLQWKHTGCSFVAVFHGLVSSLVCLVRKI